MHNKYRDLAPWNGRETADITYVDTGGILTRLFIEKGYLQSEIWQNERPKYFLEVKTTTWDYTEQFYMSGSQYQRVSLLCPPPLRGHKLMTCLDAKYALAAADCCTECIRHPTSL